MFGAEDGGAGRGGAACCGSSLAFHTAYATTAYVACSARGRAFVERQRQRQRQGGAARGPGLRLPAGLLRPPGGGGGDDDDGGAGGDAEDVGVPFGGSPGLDAARRRLARRAGVLPRCVASRAQMRALASGVPAERALGAERAAAYGVALTRALTPSVSTVKEEKEADVDVKEEEEDRKRGVWGAPEGEGEGEGEGDEGAGAPPRPPAGRKPDRHNDDDQGAVVVLGDTSSGDDGGDEKVPLAARAGPDGGGGQKRRRVKEEEEEDDDDDEAG